MINLKLQPDLYGIIYITPNFNISHLINYIPLKTIPFRMNAYGLSLRYIPPPLCI